jgi:hypothetical protein
LATSRSTSIDFIKVCGPVRSAQQGLLAEGSIRFSFSIAVDGTFCINYKALIAPEQTLGRVS